VSRKTEKSRNFSTIATNWFPGSAQEPYELQALPAAMSSSKTIQEAKPPKQRVPRQKPGNKRIRDGVPREVMKSLRGLIVHHKPLRRRWLCR
jgi:hypothetical protein